jgi:hypothetical protein
MSTLYRRKYGCSRRDSSLVNSSGFMASIASMPGSKSSFDDTADAAVPARWSKPCRQRQGLNVRPLLSVSTFAGAEARRVCGAATKNDQHRPANVAATRKPTGAFILNIMSGLTSPEATEIVILMSIFHTKPKKEVISDHYIFRWRTSFGAGRMNRRPTHGRSGEPRRVRFWCASGLPPRKHAMSAAVTAHQDYTNVTSTPCYACYNDYLMYYITSQYLLDYLI